MARKLKWGNIVGLIAVVALVGGGGWYVLNKAPTAPVQAEAQAPVNAPNPNQPSNVQGDQRVESQPTNSSAQSVGNYPTNPAPSAPVAAPAGPAKKDAFDALIYEAGKK